MNTPYRTLLFLLLFILTCSIVHLFWYISFEINFSFSILQHNETDTCYKPANELKIKYLKEGCVLYFDTSIIVFVKSHDNFDEFTRFISTGSQEDKDGCSGINTKEISILETTSSGTPYFFLFVLIKRVHALERIQYFSMNTFWSEFFAWYLDMNKKTILLVILRGILFWTW